MAQVMLRQGEAKSLPFRIKDRKTGRALNLTGATFLLWVKRSLEDAEPVFVKTDADFVKAGAASGYVTTFLKPYDTWQAPAVYQGELMISLPPDPGGNSRIEKLRFDLEILEAATPNDWILQLAGMESLEVFGLPALTLS